MAKRKTILEAVHKTARGLRDAGPMSAQTMREFDAAMKAHEKVLAKYRAAFQKLADA